MLIITDKSEKHITVLKQTLEADGFSVSVQERSGETEILVKGEVYRLDTERLRAMPGVKDIIPLCEPYHRVSRSVHPADSVIRIGGAVMVDGSFCTIAGPCSVESEEQLYSVAQAVKVAGANILRGGAFKPRTSPYSFRGLEKEGVRILTAVGKALNMPVVTEIMDVSQIEDMADIDLIQVGARSMQNYALLRALGETDKPVLLKRGYSATLTELLLSAEYIACGGNGNIILCERGIRTFSGDTRNTLDLSAVPLLREKTHLPVIVDPSHGTGLRRLVKPMAMAAAVIGADGIMVEVHNAPDCALCDGSQSIAAEDFADLQRSVEAVLPNRCRESF